MKNDKKRFYKNLFYIIFFAVGYIIQITGIVLMTCSLTIKDTEEYNLAYNYKNSGLSEIFGVSDELLESIRNVNIILYIGIAALVIGTIFMLIAIILTVISYIKNKNRPSQCNSIKSEKENKKDLPDSFQDKSAFRKSGINQSDNRRSNYQCSYMNYENSINLKSRSELYQGFIDCLSGMYCGFKIPICDNEEIVIGSNPQFCNIVLNNSAEGISRVHCSIRLDSSDHNFVVTDYSTNGTFLSDGKRLPSNYPVHLNRGEVIYLCDGTNSFRME